MGVTGHIPCHMLANEAVRAGYDGVEHINQLLLNFFADHQTDTRTPVRFSLVGEKMADRILLVMAKRAGRYVAGAALVFAGLYELTPLKEVCLRHCRGPLHFVLGGWRDGQTGALRMGVEHGLYCVGCCWGLMVALFALGVMSLAWMAMIAAVIFVQKVLPAGDRLAPVFAVAFVALGVWVAVSPGTVPGLNVPGNGAPAMHMDG